MAGWIDRLTAEHDTQLESAQKTRSDMSDEFHARGFSVFATPSIADELICSLQSACSPQLLSITDADVIAVNVYYGVPRTADSYKFCNNGVCSQIECYVLRLTVRIISLNGFLSPGRRFPPCQPGRSPPSVFAHYRSVSRQS